eukprot:COSAG05_NODE_21597_length_270_cov_1.853801_1_plen_58_part_10
MLCYSYYGDESVVARLEAQAGGFDSRCWWWLLGSGSAGHWSSLRDIHKSWLSKTMNTE